MSLLISTLVKIPYIIELHSRLKFQFEKFQEGILTETDLLQDTEYDKHLLKNETQELVQIFRSNITEKELATACEDLAVRVDNRARQVVHSLSDPVDSSSVSTGLQKINENLTSLLVRLSANYVQLSECSQRNKKLAECLGKALNLLIESPPPIFEENLEEYSNTAIGIEITYSEDIRLDQNRKIINFPGTPKFLTNLSNIEERRNILRLTHNFNPENAATLDPLPMNFNELLSPDIQYGGLGFASIAEARRQFVEFFRNGNWLEAYIFMMLEKAGCSTRLLNATLSKQGIVIEADVLALYANKLSIFEMKDRTFSDGLSDEDVQDITQKIEKIAQLKIPDLKINFVISIQDNYKEETKSTLDSLALSKGVQIDVIFLDNVGVTDNILQKIRECLR